MGWNEFYGSAAVAGVVWMAFAVATLVVIERRGREESLLFYLLGPVGLVMALRLKPSPFKCHKCENPVRPFVKECNRCLRRRLAEAERVAHAVKWQHERIRHSH